MKADGLFVIMMIVFIFAAWIATGGPTRPIATAGPWITPVTRSGEESQGYRSLAPSNPTSNSAYPRQIGGASSTISAGPSQYQRAGAGTDSSPYLEHSVIGPSSGNPNQEYISIINPASQSVTLTGWKLKSKSTGATVTIPSITLKAKARGSVVTGRAAANQLPPGVCTTSTSCVFLDRNLELFTSSKETISLINVSGKTVDTFAY